ncbi:MAG: NADH:flavin oxidoreductase/NADH oxidase family protein [Gammaproteobacteria bacterium]|nr:MAG: NADH:flavin oxidoreductase/NADH oxidase family protein [Gammaproteobacteria bacterium]
MTILKEQITLPCGAKIKNRICKAAMTERIAFSNNFTNQRHLNLYKKWADGDIGILLTGNVQVDKDHLEGPANVCIEEKSYSEQLPLLRKWAEEGTRNNTHLWMQISHAGRQTPGEINQSPKAPSSVQLKIPGRNYGIPSVLTTEEIQEIIKKFTFVAKIARETGFSGIQIHSAHGYLLSEFLSPDINLREDEWGGTVENRSRIHVEIIKSIRQEVGEDFPISVKMNSADFQKGGFSPKDSIQVAKIVESAGVDNIEISGGTYEQPRLLGLDNVSINPDRSETRKESTIAREAYFLEYADKIKKNIQIPLMVTGGFRTKQGMEDAIKSGACEIVGVGRPLCANPYAIKEMFEGKTDHLPIYEKTLSLGPWILSPSSPFRLIQALNAFGAQAWFYQQIKRMGDNKLPDLSLGLFSAFRKDASEDKQAFKNLNS